MKHSTPDLMKFKKLQRRLKLPRYAIVGLLESLWICTQKNTPRGDIGKFDNESIAIELDWEGDPDDLINALVETGWLDENEEHRLLIHDWESNAPRYVHGIVSKKGGFIGYPTSTTTVDDYSQPLQSTTEDRNEGNSSDQLACARLNHTTPNLTKPNHTTPQGRPRLSGVGGVLTNLKAEDLKNPERLNQIAESIPAFRSEHGKLLIAAAALRALDNAKTSPGGMFRTLVETEHAKLCELVEPYMQEASQRMRSQKPRNCSQNPASALAEAFVVPKQGNTS